MGLSRSQNVEQGLPEERKSGKNLLQIKWRTFSGPALPHEHTDTKHRHACILLGKPKSCLTYHSIPRLDQHYVFRE